MGYFNGNTELTTKLAIELVKAGLDSGAITLANNNHYSEEVTGRNAGAYIGAMIAELADRLSKL